MKKIIIDENPYIRSKIFSEYRTEWFRRKDYPHSFNDYMREYHRCILHDFHVSFENEKDYNWFLLNL